jgi:two-component system NtrC family response regulator
VNSVILLVDDDASLRRILSHHLERAGYTVRSAADGSQALALLAAGPADLVLTDVRMPGMDGRALLAEVRRGTPDLPVLMMTAYGTIQDAVEAMRQGAFDYLTKPVDKETLLRAVHRALQIGNLRRENRLLRENLVEHKPLEAILGTSAAVDAMRDLIRKAGPTTATVLLTGESGTGKELAARALHALSLRSKGPFVALNCAALTPDLLESELFGHAKGSFTGAVADHPGKFRQAGGGTLFLDEIGDMDIRLQAKILRALQERVVDPVGSRDPVPVDVRLVAATNKDLSARVREGLFREDLFYRLAVLAIRVPALRERGADRLLLMKHFYRLHGGGDLNLEAQAQLALEAYSWPGNIREMMNVCQRLAILSPRQTVTPDLLPSEIVGAAPATIHERQAPEAGGLWAQERAAIVTAMQENGGNRSAAARALRVPRHILLYRIKKYGLE